MEEISHFVQWGFYALLSGGVWILVKILGDINKELKKMSRDLILKSAEVDHLKEGYKDHHKRIGLLERVR